MADQLPSCPDNKKREHNSRQPTIMMQCWNPNQTLSNLRAHGRLAETHRATRKCKTFRTSHDQSVTDPSSFVCIVVDAQVAMYATAISEFVCCCCLAALLTYLLTAMLRSPCLKVCGSCAPLQVGLSFTKICGMPLTPDAFAACDLDRTCSTP